MATAWAQRKTTLLDSYINLHENELSSFYTSVSDPRDDVVISAAKGHARHVPCQARSPSSLTDEPPTRMLSCQLLEDYLKAGTLPYGGSRTPAEAEGPRMPALHSNTTSTMAPLVRGTGHFSMSAHMYGQTARQDEDCKLLSAAKSPYQTGSLRGTPGKYHSQRGNRGGPLTGGCGYQQNLRLREGRSGSSPSRVRSTNLTTPQAVRPLRHEIDSSQGPLPSGRDHIQKPSVNLREAALNRPQWPSLHGLAPATGTFQGQTSPPSNVQAEACSTQPYNCFPSSRHMIRASTTGAILPSARNIQDQVACNALAFGGSLPSRSLTSRKPGSQAVHNQQQPSTFSGTVVRADEGAKRKSWTMEPPFVTRDPGIHSQGAAAPPPSDSVKELQQLKDKFRQSLANLEAYAQLRTAASSIKRPTHTVAPTASCPWDPPALWSSRECGSASLRDDEPPKHCSGDFPWAQLTSRSQISKKPYRRQPLRDGDLEPKERLDCSMDERLTWDTPGDLYDKQQTYSEVLCHEAPQQAWRSGQHVSMLCSPPPGRSAGSVDWQQRVPMKSYRPPRQSQQYPLSLSESTSLPKDPWVPRAARQGGFLEMNQSNIKGEYKADDPATLGDLWGTKPSCNRSFGLSCRGVAEGGGEHLNRDSNGMLHVPSSSARRPHVRPLHHRELQLSSRRLGSRYPRSSSPSLLPSSGRYTHKLLLEPGPHDSHVALSYERASSLGWWRDATDDKNHMDGLDVLQGKVPGSVLYKQMVATCGDAQARLHHDGGRHQWTIPSMTDSSMRGSFSKPCASARKRLSLIQPRPHRLAERLGLGKSKRYPGLRGSLRSTNTSCSISSTSSSSYCSSSSGCSSSSCSLSSCTTSPSSSSSPSSEGPSLEDQLAHEVGMKLKQRGELEQ